MADEVSLTGQLAPGPGHRSRSRADTPESGGSAARLSHALAQINDIVLGKERQVKLCLACILAGGHLLIEDVPGVGKTTLAQALARSLGLSFQRIQFTSDLLPADVVGVSIFDQLSGGFRFRPGPVFAQILLADEINRATPKAQSALLEAMEERQVTVDGETRALPEPFFVIATQNPATQAGTFALPESQLDRFLMRIQLGYPDARAERALLRGEDRRDAMRRLHGRLSAADILALQRQVREIHASEALLDYVQALVARTRRPGRFVAGLSPRSTVNLLQAARAWAHLDGRGFVLPEDIQNVLPGVAGHRLQPIDATGERAQEESISALIAEVPLP
ncbi:MAG: AAA family ATPase [Burkholderiales bacterium]|nr:AAA family ATPase [Burkholderiales bacterium]